MQSSPLIHAAVSVLSIAFASTVHADSRAAVTATYARLPLAFEENRGQAAPQVRFLARGPGYSVLLTPTETVFSLARKGQDQPAVFQMHLVGPNAKPAMEGQNALPGRMNYFIGRDPAKWHTGVPTYARVRYHNVYAGIDLMYYGNQRQFEYDFLVAPGFDPGAIRMAFEGSGIPSINARGDLVLHIAGGDIHQAKPVAYQEIGGVRHTVAARYVIDRKGQVGIRVGTYDRSWGLVIDPYLIYSTYFGGLGVDVGTGIAVDGQGNAYVAGYTNSVFVVPAVYPPPPQPPAGMNGFVAKLSPDGKSLVWGTYLGGGGNDRALGITLDSSGAYAYVTGDTSSTDFPAVASPQPAYGGGDTDAFVAKLATSNGTLPYASYLGGSAADSGAAIAVDASGNVYVAGTTDSYNFPTTANAYKQQRIPGDTGSDGFVAKIDQGGSLAYSTYLGGTGIDVIRALARDSSSGLIYVAGGTLSSDFPEKAFQPTGTCGIGAAPVLQQADAFVAALDPNAIGEASLKLSARLGGDGDDIANGIAVSRSGGSAYVYLTGETRSSCVPYSWVSGSLQGYSDAFVTYLIVPDQFSSVPVYSWAFFGGGGDDRGTSIIIGYDSQMYLAGETSSCNFPGSAARTFPCPKIAFMANIPSPSYNTTAFSALLGPPGTGPLGPAVVMSQPENCTCFGNIYVTGSASESFPTTSDALQGDFAGGASDAFVAFLSHVAAMDQSVSTPQDTPKSITLSGHPVDNCPSCGLSSYPVPGYPLHGTLTYASSPANTYVYQPNAGYIGPDQFLFTVFGSSYRSFPGTVNITVLDGTPPTVSVSLTPTPLFPAFPIGTNLTLSVTASDVGRGGSDIDLIEYFIGSNDGSGPSTGWVPLGENFGSPQAMVTANIIAPTTPGGYVLGVRARDAAGNWGNGIPPLFLFQIYDPAISVKGSGAVPVGGESAHFDFDFKYAGKANLPSGSLHFESKTAGVNFNAVRANWMGWTLEGSVKRWTVFGSGVLNGVGTDCGFRLYITDGNPDAFGLSICGSQFNLPSTVVTSGNITMHVK